MPSAAIQVLWAKSGEKSAGVGWLPVLHHLLDVGACAWAILGREPQATRDLLTADFGTDTDTARRWTCALAALHDLGKASPAFQHKAPELAARVWAVLPEQDYSKNTPHGMVTQKLLPDLLTRTGRDWPERVARGVAGAIGCHHGQRESSSDYRAPDRGAGPQWDRVQEELLTLVLRGFDLEHAPPPPITDWTGEAFMRLAGLTSFADWVGSSFEMTANPDPLAYSNPAAYVQQAGERASMALDAIGWTVREPLVPQPRPLDETFAFLPDFKARPLQTLLAEVLSASDSRPALVLVEAPMGEGKTEAAFYSHLQLQNAAGHRGLYVALPTQATGNAMYTRLREFLGQQITARAEPVTVDLQLLHGGAALHSGYQANLSATVQMNAQTRARPTDEQKHKIRPNLPGEPGDSVHAGEWFSHRKRALLSEYGVGTVDQALLGVLNVNHQFVRLWGLGNRVVVLDEVHAYDTYTTQLIQTLCRWLRALKSSVIIMSATLPAQTRRELLSAWNVMPDTAPTYPRLTVARTGDAAPISHHIPGPRRRLALNLKATDPAPEAMAAQAVALAHAGGTVTVIVNTVQRAQDILRVVREMLGKRYRSIRRGSSHPQRVNVHLYHARYPADERSEREKRVLRHLGQQPAHYEQDGQERTDDQRPERFILIATQVAEQSLDFDTDVMISDLAPIDLLLQRAGRLHRHDKNNGRRGAHEQPVLYVAGLGNWPEQPLDDYHWKYIYAPALMYRTWHALGGRTQITLPDDLDDLVQGVYDPASPPLDGLSDTQRNTLAKADRKLQHQRQQHGTLGDQAHIGTPDNLLDLPHQPSWGEPDGEPTNDDTDPSKGEMRFGTRLGDESFRIVPVHRHEGAIYLNIKDRIPAQILKLGKGDWDSARTIYARSFQVSRYDVIDHFRRNPPRRGTAHEGWGAHPLLRDAMPLVLDDGEATLGRTHLRLDPELGLTYERLE